MAARGCAVVLLLAGFAPAHAASYDDAWSPAAEAAAQAAMARGSPPVRTLVATVRQVPALVAGTAAGSRALAASVKDLREAVSGLDGKETELEVRIDLPGDVLFDVDQALIRPDAAQALAQLAVVIRAYTGPVQLIGHTDSDGSDEHNLALSQRRAAAVMDWLVSREAIPAQRFSTAGRGEAEPRAANDTAANKQRNRRVEVVVRKR